MNQSEVKNAMVAVELKNAYIRHDKTCIMCGDMRTGSFYEFIEITEPEIVHCNNFERTYIRGTTKGKTKIFEITSLDSYKPLYLVTDYWLQQNKNQFVQKQKKK